MSVGGAIRMHQADIIIVAGGMWTERWTTYQPVANGLRRYFRVLYVEANYSLGKVSKACMRAPYPRTLSGRLRRVDDGFTLLTPPPRLPFRHYSGPIGRLNQIILRGAIRKAVEKTGLREPVLWIFLHQSSRLVGRLFTTAWTIGLGFSPKSDSWEARVSSSAMNAKPPPRSTSRYRRRGSCSGGWKK